MTQLQAMSVKEILKYSKLQDKKRECPHGFTKSISEGGYSWAWYNSQMQPQKLLKQVGDLISLDAHTVYTFQNYLGLTVGKASQTCHNRSL